MTKIKRHPALLGALACLACLVAWAGYMVGTATAAGDLTPGPLFYKGYMTDTSGAPITGKQNVEIKVWSSKGVGEFCSTSKLSVPVDKGHFKIALKSQCAVLLHTYTAPWVEVFVAGKSLGLSKLGAAPSAARVAGLSEQSCPVGYTASSAGGVVLCKRGADELVKVADFWIDRYEAAVVTKATFNDGDCQGKWDQYGTASDNYDPDFPDNGAWKQERIACSVVSRAPSVHLSWFQAQQACLLAGKRLCTHAEWMTAALGTPDSAVCNFNSSGPTAPKSTSACVSNRGVVNMPGNAWEWVAEWRHAGSPFTGFTAGKGVSAWPSSAYGGDATYNFNGTVYISGAYGPSLPTAVHAGGAFMHKAESGTYTMGYSGAPSIANLMTGVRCCRN